MYVIITLIIIVIAIVLALQSSSNEAKKLEDLKLKYDKALKGTNKRIALEAGRNYYSALRKGKELTIYDEQAITNDLSTMSTGSKSPAL